MAKGGARAKSGPPPSPTSGTTDRKGLTYRTLPADGYAGPTPAFPLVPPTTRVGDHDAEIEAIEERIWGEVWRLPQAAAWAAEPWRIYSVGQWTRVAALCETGRGTASDRTVMMRLQEEIGLTGAGMARNLWQIGDGAAAGTAAKAAPRKRSARDRLAVKVIDGGRK